MATTTDVILLQYQVDLSALQAGYDKIEAAQKDIQQSGQKSTQSITDGANKASGATDNLTKSTSTLKDKLSDVASNLPFANQIQQVSQLASGVTGVGAAASKSSAGFQILKLAIAGTGIGALVIAIVALIAYFKKTDEGAASLTGIMSSLGAAADLVTGAVVGLGEGVFNALTSVNGLKKGISDLGDYIIGTFLNRIKAPLVALEALQLAIGGDFVGASKKFLDATVQAATGITDFSKKASDFTDKAAAAAKAAYDWEIAMDALEDKVRSDSTAIAENNAAITKLIIAAKNKQITDEQSLANLDKATQLEKQNFATTLSNEQARLVLIQKRNQRESDAINQDIKNGQKRRSINDDLVQEEVDQINKIIGLRQDSENLLEKVENRRDAKLEEIFQNSVKRISQEEVLQENAAKQSFLDGTATAEQLEQALYQIKLDGLNKQKELLVSDSRDIVDIDKAIIDLELANELAANKAKSDADKAAVAAHKKLIDDQNKADLASQKTAFAALDKALSDEQKKDIDDAKKQQDQKNQIISAGANVVTTLATGLYNDLAQKRQNDLNDQLASDQKKYQSASDSLQQQLDNGIISQSQYNSKKATLDAAEAKKEAQIKLQQFQANKRAQLIDIAISTAVAVAKTLATLGFPAGEVAALEVAAVGLAQAAVVTAQPTPKYLAKGQIDIDGPGSSTSDSIYARLSRGESVMTAKETTEHKSALLAMRARNYNEYVKHNYVLPALEKQQRENISRRENNTEQTKQLLKIIANNNIDTSQMERLIKNNNKIGVKNVSEIAKAFSKEMVKHRSWYR